MNVYCVIAHRDPKEFRSLIDALPGRTILVHLDEKCDRSSFLKTLGELPQNVKVLGAKESFRINWAGWNMVRAEFAVFRRALPFLDKDDYAILLSGVCYPCRPVEFFEEFLRHNGSKELVSYNALNNVHTLNILSTGPGGWRVKYLNLRDLVVPPIKPLVKMIYRLRDVVNNLKIPNPSYDQNYEYYVGSQ